MKKISWMGEELIQFNVPYDSPIFYKTDLGLLTNILAIEVTEWLTEFVGLSAKNIINIGPEFPWMTSREFSGLAHRSSGLNILFYNINDAMLFKLTWMGS